MKQDLDSSLCSHFSNFSPDPFTEPKIHIERPETDSRTQDFREVFSEITKSISVIGVRLEDGIWGATVDSFSSVSLTPPLIMVSMRKGSTALKAMLDTRAFGVSLLAANQVDMAQLFAGHRNPYPESESEFLFPNGDPILPGTVAWFSCRLYQTGYLGNHVLVIAEVIEAGKTDTAPLVRAKSSYGTITGYASA